MENIGIIATTVLAFAAIVGLVYSHVKELGEVKQRLSTVETKVEPFWEFVQKKIPDILTRGKGNPEPLTRRDELLVKFKDGTILPHERDELLTFLEADQEKAKKERDTALLIALGLLIVALVAASKK